VFVAVLTAQEVAIQAKKQEDKRLKRIYGNWRRLVRGLLIRERIRNNYLEDGPSWLDSPPRDGNLEDSSEDEGAGKPVAEKPGPNKAKKGKQQRDDADETIEAKMKKLRELEKLLVPGRPGPSR
jgi:hypothetical protein